MIYSTLTNLPHFEFTHKDYYTNLAIGVRRASQMSGIERENILEEARNKFPNDILKLIDKEIIEICYDETFRKAVGKGYEADDPRNIRLSLTNYLLAHPEKIIRK
jgi:hypothetical protein